MVTGPCRPGVEEADDKEAEGRTVFPAPPVAVDEVVDGVDGAAIGVMFAPVLEITR